MSAQERYNSNDTAARFARQRKVFYEKHFRKIDIPSVIDLLNGIGISGKTVIDYGCGSGFYTRIIAKIAQRVVGVDKSQQMVDLGIELNKKEGIKNVDYYVSDCANILNLGEFDLVFSSFFIQFAPNRDILKGFVQSMFNSLKSKHICCGLMPNFKLKPDEFKYLYKYGFMYIRDKNAKDFDIQTVNTFEKECETSELLYECSFYYISPETTEQIFNEVGFINFKWMNLSLPDKFVDEKEYFHDYLTHPSAIFYYAEKP